MEAVAALRQDPDLVPVSELGEADGALGELPAATRSGGGVEGERREGAEGLLLETLTCRPKDGGGGGGGRGAEPGAASDEGKAEDADEGAEERRDDDDEVGVDREGVGPPRGVEVVGGLEKPRQRRQHHTGVSRERKSGELRGRCRAGTRLYILKKGDLSEKPPRFGLFRNYIPYSYISTSIS